MQTIAYEDVVKVAALPYDWDKLAHKTILLSGGTGLIGSFLCDVFRYRNEKFHSDIKLISLSRKGGSSDDTVTYLSADVNKPIAMDDHVDYVLHLASNTHPKQYGEDPVGTITTNVFGCYHLLELAKKLNARFLLASSVEIYGQGDAFPMDETFSGYLDPNQARSGYNEAKRVCEALCQSYIKQYGMDCVIVRLARVFGVDKKADTKAMSQFLDKAVAGENIILNSKGSQRYSFCYVADAASGILKVLLNGECGSAYNISADDEGKTLGDYAEFLADLAGVEVRYQLQNDAAASKATFALLNNTKIKSIGWEPLYSVSDGLLRTYKLMNK